jgi:hypothetical protein
LCTARTITFPLFKGFSLNRSSTAPISNSVPQPLSTSEQLDQISQKKVVSTNIKMRNSRDLIVYVNITVESWSSKQCR